MSVEETVSNVASAESNTEILSTPQAASESKNESVEQSTKTAQSSLPAEISTANDESQSVFYPTPTAANNEANENDETAIANRIIDYLNNYRAAIGSNGLQKLSGLTEYAKYRSNQLTAHFAHDTNDERAAATALKYGQYINPAEFGLEGVPYYTAYTSEAIANSGFHGSVDEVAKHFADMCRKSLDHWAYIGSSGYSFVGVGITYYYGFWYLNISLTNTSEFER
ncbi:MAG: MSCRAMM family adhesin SdrC [Clostridia bacterium]|nr:MSCRAMM family adhesin SdrC [Clostridia bacterium]